MTEKEQQFERIYEKTKDFGRTQFVREIQIQINDNKKKDKKIKELQKKAELGEHYKQLYSEVKKQKDDVVEYCKKAIESLNWKKRSIMQILTPENGYLKTDIEIEIDKYKEILRMLGETNEFK